MLRTVSCFALISLVFMAAGCMPDGEQQSPAPDGSQATLTNPVFHFEIPVTDMDRAVAFYQDVFGYRLTRETIDGYEMAFFPRADGRPGASGALAQGDVYRPSHDGPVIYFDVPDIDAVLALAVSKGSGVLYPKKDIGDAGFVAEIEDSEGNRIALSQVKP